MSNKSSTKLKWDFLFPYGGIMKIRRMALALVPILVLTFGLSGCGEGAKGYDYNQTDNSVKEGTVLIGDYLMNVYEDHASAYKYFGNGAVTTVPNVVNYTDSKGKKLEVPVTSIMERCFYRNYNLESVTVPENVKSIEDRAFYDLKSLRELNLSEGLENLGIIENTHSLEYIIIPKSCKKFAEFIESSIWPKVKEFVLSNRQECYYTTADSWFTERTTLFNGEWELVNGKPVSKFQKRVEVNGFGYDIYGDAAYLFRASGLLGNSVTIPSSIDAYSDVDGRQRTYKVTSISFGDSFSSQNNDVNELILSEGITSLYGTLNDAFPNLTKIQIPSSVAEISSGFFSKSNKLVTVDFDSTNKSIEYKNNCLIRLSDKRLVFSNDVCVVPDGIEIIGSDSMVFRQTVETRKIVFPDSVKRIEKVFYDTNAKNLIFEIGKSVEYLPYLFVQSNQTYSSKIYYRGTLTDWLKIERIGDDPKNYKEPSNYFLNTLYLQNDDGTFEQLPSSFVIPDEISEIKNGAFFGISCGEVTIGSNVISIGDGAFAGGLTKINFAKNGLKYIGDYVFNSLTLTMNDLPDTLECFGKAAFYCFGNLYGWRNYYILPNDEFYWPKSLRKMDNIFNIDSRVNLTTKIMYQGTINDWLNIDQCGDFSHYASSSLLFVKDGETYKAVSDYTDFVIPDGTKCIHDNAFHGFNFQNITIPASVKSIGRDAFSRCGLSNVEFKGNIDYIGIGAFSSNKITSLQLPDSVGCIDNEAFFSTNLHNLKLPNHCKYIGYTAFYFNYDLNSVIIPEDISYFGKHVFGNNYEYVINVFLEASSVPETWDTEWLMNGKENTPKDEEGNAVSTYYLKGQWSLVNGVPTPNN